MNAEELVNTTQQRSDESAAPEWLLSFKAPPNAMGSSTTASAPASVRQRSCKSTGSRSNKDNSRKGKSDKLGKSEGKNKGPNGNIMSYFNKISV